MKKIIPYDIWLDNLKFRIFAFTLKYDLKREYFTVGIPVLVAIVLVLFAILTGHTLIEEKSQSSEKSDREKALEELIRQMEEEERGAETVNQTAATKAPEPEEKKADLDHYIIYAGLIAITPYSIDRYLQRREKKKKEEDYSLFLFKMSELMRAGIDPIKSVIELSKTDLGSINKHIILSASSMMLGNSFEEGMKKVTISINSAAIKSELISKYNDLVIQASYTGGSVANLILKASEDMRSMIMIEREMEGNLKQYVLIFYFAQVILIVLVFILSTQLFPSLLDSGMKAIFGGGGIANINYKQGFFHLLIINAIIGGVIIGKVTEGSAKDGLKHCVILTIVSYLACVLVIFPAGVGENITIKVVSGNLQTGYIGLGLEEPIIFQVLDPQDKPKANVFLSIDITPSGKVFGGTTDKQGKLSVKVLLGDDPGTYSITATSGKASATAIANAIGS
jgi:flagellar protein FlaJ